MSDRIVLDRDNLERLIKSAREGAMRAFDAGLSRADSYDERRDIRLMIQGAQIILDGLDEAATLMPRGVFVPIPQEQHIPYLDN